MVKITPGDYPCGSVGGKVTLIDHLVVNIIFIDWLVVKIIFIDRWVVKLTFIDRLVATEDYI